MEDRRAPLWIGLASVLALVGASGMIGIATLQAATTPHPAHYWTNPWVVVSIVALCVGLLIFLWLIVDPAKRKRGQHTLANPAGGSMSDDPGLKAGSKNPSVDQSVTSHGQSGGITAHQVTVSAPAPSVNGNVVKSSELSEDGRFLTEVAIQLEAQDAMSRLTVEVHGASILHFRMHPVNFAHNSQGTHVEGVQGSEGPPWTMVSRTWVPPLGRTYSVAVWTAQPEALDIRAFPG